MTIKRLGYLVEFEPAVAKRLIKDTFKEYGTLTATAKALDITLMTLYRYRERLGLDLNAPAGRPKRAS